MPRPVGDTEPAMQLPRAGCVLGTPILSGCGESVMHRDVSEATCFLRFEDGRLKRSLKLLVLEVEDASLRVIAERAATLSKLHNL
jgi:hypothetical protein